MFQESEAGMAGTVNRYTKCELYMSEKKAIVPLATKLNVLLMGPVNRR